MRSYSKFKARLALMTGVFALFASCGKEAMEGSYTVPRGVTISVRTGEPISASGHEAGRAFTAALEAPLAEDSRVFAPIGSRVDGVVDEISEDENGLAQITIRAVRLHLPNGQVLELDTAPITRGARALFDTASEIRADRGIEKKIQFLAETGDVGSSDTPPPDADPALIPAESNVVFSLTSELVLPPPQQ